MRSLAALGWPEGMSTWPDQPEKRPGVLSEITSWLSFELLEALIDSNSLEPRHLSLIANGELVSRERFVADDRIVGGAVRAHLNQGGTVSLRALEDRLPSVRAACEDLSDQLGHPTQANAYLTPPGRQGFSHHWDTHITVAIQIHGQKTWELAAPVVEAPVFPHLAWPKVGFTDEQNDRLQNSPPEQSILLTPGDVLWVPRGWIHNPFSAGSSDDPPSLHLTIGIRQRTVADTAANLVTQAWTQPDLRRALPPNFDRSTEARVAADLLVRWLASFEGRYPPEIRS
jgi:hypothetical protein